MKNPGNPTAPQKDCPICAGTGIAKQWDCISCKFHLSGGEHYVICHCRDEEIAA